MELQTEKRHGVKDVVVSEVGVLSVVGMFYAICCAGAFAIFARFFLNWYEGDWGPEYYLDEYENGIFSDFSGMLQVIMVTGIVCVIIGVIVWFIGRHETTR